MAVQELFVVEPAVPGSPEPGEGTPSDPFQSVQDALDRAQEQGGARIKVGAGHYVECIVLENFDVDHGAIVVEPDDSAAGQVFIHACLPEFLFPESADDQWTRVGAPGDGIDEYVWGRRYESVGEGPDAAEKRRVRSGALLDEPRHTRLVSYDRREDLVARNQLWPDKATLPPAWPEEAKPGNRVWRLHPEHQKVPRRYIPEDRNEQPWYRPWVYMGPGVWFDQSDRRVHIRLSATNHDMPGWPRFDPASTDPNEARVALSMEDEPAVWLRRCHQMRFVDLTIRFGSPETVRLRECTNIVFDRCRIRSGSRAFRMIEDGQSMDGITITDCEIDGGLPTWFFRSDRKDEYVFGSDITDEEEMDALNAAGGVPESEVTRNRLGYSTGGVLISGAGAIGQVTVRNCEIYNGHDCYLFGNGMRFHHNWVHNLNDDGVAVSADGHAHEVDVHSNVMTKCLTGLSFAGDRVGPVHIYANLFDLRLPTLGRRPKTAADQDVLRQGHFFKDGGEEGEINLFHNTCLVCDPGALGDGGDGVVNDVGFAYYSVIGSSDARSAYNNIFVAAYSAASLLRPIAMLAPESFACEAAGNMYFRIPADSENAHHNFLVRRRNVATEVVPAPPEERPFDQLADYWDFYWPGQPTDQQPVHERASRLKNPWFKSFDTSTGRPRRGDDLRLWRFLLWKSPAKGTAVVMLIAGLTEKYVAATGAQPEDRGCYPPNGDPLRVGVNHRRVFPPPPQTDVEPDTHSENDWPLARTP